MRTVFNNDELFHIYAQQTQVHGRSSNASFDDVLAYSYNQCIGHIEGKDIFIINWVYSHTTNRHIGKLKAATSHYNQILVEYPSHPNSNENIEDFVKSFKNLIESLAKAKKPEIYILKIKKLQDNVNKYKKALNIDSVELDEIINFSYDKSGEMLLKVRQELNKQKEMEKIRAEKELREWRNFERCYVYNPFDKVYLRVKNNIVETSKNVKISLDKVIPFVKIYKRFLEGEKSNLSALIGKHLDCYTINNVTNKNVVIGCHNIPKNEILALLDHKSN